MTEAEGRDPAQSKARADEAGAVPGAAPDRHAGLLDDVPVGLYRCTPDGRLLDVNAALVALLGFPDHQTLLGTPTPLLYNRAGDRERWLATLERDGVVRDFEIQIRRGDGSLIWVEDSAHAFRDAQGRVTNYVGVLVDVTERRQSDEALRRSEERFLLAARATKDTLWDWDFASDDIWWNEGITSVFGYPPHQAGDFMTWTTRLHPDDRDQVVSGIQAVVAGGGTSWADDYRFRRADGTYAFVYNRAYVQRDNDGRAARMIGAMMDITHRHALETQLRHAQKMEAVGRLAGGIAHDFNNLLTAIIGHTDLVLGDIAADDANRSGIEEVAAAAHRAATLTRQLLAFSRKQTLRPRPLDLNVVVASLEQMLRRLIGEDISLETSLEASLGTVRADQSQLDQVIVNLVVNARDAMPRGGTLRLESANVVLDEEFTQRHPYATPGPHVRFSVQDDGVGMSADTLSRLFEPFFTTKEVGKGTGLGLATVYGIVRQSGGVIDVASEPTKGSRFDIYLPRTADAAGSARTTDTKRSRGGTETILLVEDEPLVRQLALRVLQRSGYNVVEAADAAAALRVAASHTERIHLLLTDVVMPGMRGDELAARLLAERPGLRVLYVSGYADGAIDEGKAAPAGGELLPKPFTPDRLAGKVREVLDEVRSTEAG